MKFDIFRVQWLRVKVMESVGWPTGLPTDALTKKEDAVLLKYEQFASIFAVSQENVYE